MQRFTVAVLVKNQFGVLNRVTSMFRRRRFNISALSVSETESAEFSRITVLFDGEGMTVVYSPYELGPYAMGTVELKASYEELAQLLGPGGLERLGLAEEEAQDPGGT